MTDIKDQKQKGKNNMATPAPINELLQKRMDRKDFLKHVGIGVAVLTGAAGVIKMFKPGQSSSLGYGSSAYGGKPQTSRG